MKFFQKIYALSTKGFGFALLSLLLSGLFYAISIVVVLNTHLLPVLSSGLDSFAKKTGCAIVEYELDCYEDYYEYEGLIIDLNFNDEDAKDLSPETVVFTKTKVYYGGNAFEYQTLIDAMKLEPNQTMDELIDTIEGFVKKTSVRNIFTITIVATIYYSLAHLVMASIVQSMIKKRTGENKFSQAYKLTAYIALPYIVFNALTRMVISASLPGLISSIITNFLPLIGLASRIGIDLGILSLLTALVLKYGLPKPEQQDEVIEGEVVVTSPVEENIEDNIQV